MCCSSPSNQDSNVHHFPQLSTLEKLEQETFNPQRSQFGGSTYEAYKNANLCDLDVPYNEIDMNIDDVLVNNESV